MSSGSYGSAYCSSEADSAPVSPRLGSIPIVESGRLSRPSVVFFKNLDIADEADVWWTVFKHGFASRGLLTFGTLSPQCNSTSEYVKVKVGQRFTYLAM